MKFEIKSLNEWLIVALIVIIAGTAGYMFYGNGHMIGYLFNQNPGAIILGLETVAAINIFGGTVPDEIGIDFETASILISIVILLMLGPWLLYIGYKQDEKNDKSAFKPWYWFLGSSLCVFSLTSIPVLIISFIVFQNTQSSVELSRTQDLMRQELQYIGFEAAEYGILKDGFDDSFSISNLDLNGLEFEYEIQKTSSDSSIIIVARNLEPGKGGNKLEVMPFCPEVMAFRN